MGFYSKADAIAEKCCRLNGHQSGLLTAELLEFPLVFLREIHKFDPSPFPLDPSDFRSGNL